MDTKSGGEAMNIEDRSPTVRDDQIAAVILQLCMQRGTGKTICPSEAARALTGKEGAWREQMEHVRRVASVLVQDGRIEVTQRGNPVDPNTAQGPIRLGLPQQQG